MPRSVISYDKDLPEVPEREPHLPPTAYLRRKPGSTEEFEVVEGRRPSKLLLVNTLRLAVGEWRAAGYPGASDVTKRLFTYWFAEDHLIANRLFRYYFGQREAVETIVYLTEIERNRDAKALVETFGEIYYPDSAAQRTFDTGIAHETTMDGTRRIRRYLPELAGFTVQDLPPVNLRRYACKMATGSGKTVVMAMLVAWSYFHRRLVPGSDLSTNFLVVAPNVIVYQRLAKDFESNRVFHDYPLIPPEWQGQWSLKVILRGESAEPDPSGTLFLTNIHQIYESKQAIFTPANAVEALLGPRPSQNLASHERSMLERIKSLPNLVVMNDEAHHVHDEDLEWNKTLSGIHRALPGGLALWLDFSATPKDQNGSYFPWIICDYPLAQAIEDRIVKAPLIVHQVRKDDPERVTPGNVIEAYGPWLMAALTRWQQHFATYQELRQKPVLFIMAEHNDLADAIGAWLVTNSEQTGLKQNEVLIIHVKERGKDAGEVAERDLDTLRQQARDIDRPGNRIKVIVSVLMLREGWDVRNVTVVLGLRPFTASAKILPEQAVGRGLRLMLGVSPDRTQTLEVMGTAAFENFVRELEAEGVGIQTTTTPPAPPVKIAPVLEKLAYDIAIPLPKPMLERNYTRLNDLDPKRLEPLYDQPELPEPLRLRMEYVVTETGVHQMDIAFGTPPLAQQVLSSITNKVIGEARLNGQFARLYPLVRGYVATCCFGQPVDLADEQVRSFLQQLLVQEAIAKYLARQIGVLTAERRPVQFSNRGFRLSQTSPFTWRRNLPLLVCRKTVFNLVATYNSFEKTFAQFLDRCPDIVRFGSLGSTEQETAGNFFVSYLKPSGALGLYYPDWAVVQSTAEGEVNWVIETKGRVWDGTENKDAAIRYWCEQVSSQTGASWRYLRVNQTDFGGGQFLSFAGLLESLAGVPPAIPPSSTQ